jgi:opacity protein-like surface antigen
MKRTLILSLILAVPSFAGTSQVAEYSPPPQAQDNLWNWFIGGTAGYLIDSEEDMYTLQVGAKSPWMFGGWNVALFAEAGWTENHNALVGVPPFGGGNPDLDLVPIIFNVKLEHLITGGLSAYVGGGLGTTYLDADFNTPAGGRHRDDWVLTGQVFAGLAYHVNDNLELFGGARWICFDDPDFNGVSLDDDIMVEGGLRYHF